MTNQNPNQILFAILVNRRYYRLNVWVDLNGVSQTFRSDYYPDKHKPGGVRYYTTLKVFEFLVDGNDRELKLSNLIQQQINMGWEHPEPSEVADWINSLPADHPLRPIVALTPPEASHPPDPHQTRAPRRTSL